MKRLNSSDDFVSEAEEKSRNKTQIYSTEFQAMLDGLIQDECGGEAEELGDAVADKKRRLSSGQVKVLEKNFEVESKLEPERKSQLAEELGLQPRQVAIWFQNRRARFKTKQLERDYVILKENYNSLKLDFDNLEQENEALLAEVMELKMKLNQENADSNAVLYAAAAKEEEESPASESMTNAITINGVDKEFDFLREDSKFLTFQQSSSPLLNWIQFSNSRSSAAADEHRSLVNTEESCSFFSVDHAPTMHW